MKTEKPKNRLHTEYYQNDQKKVEGNYKDGVKDGKWTEWFENGQILKEKNYKDGVKDGEWIEWLFPPDDKISSEDWKDGVKHGVFSYWNYGFPEFDNHTCFKDGKEVHWQELFPD